MSATKEFYHDEIESNIRMGNFSKDDISYIRTTLNIEALSGDSIEELTLAIECEKKHKNITTVINLYKNRIKRLQLLYNDSHKGPIK